MHARVKSSWTLLKAFAIGVLVIPLLAGCASPPRGPLTDKDSVIFYSTGIRQVGEKRFPYSFVYLKFRNTGTGATFDGTMIPRRDLTQCQTEKYVRVYIVDGVCYLMQSFAMPPGDYVLSGYHVYMDAGLQEFHYRRNAWNHAFTLRPGESTYVGHITYLYDSGDSHAESMLKSRFEFTDHLAEDHARFLKIDPELSAWKVNMAIPLVPAFPSGGRPQ